MSANDFLTSWISSRLTPSRSSSDSCSCICGNAACAKLSEHTIRLQASFIVNRCDRASEEDGRIGDNRHLQGFVCLLTLLEEDKVASLGRD